MRALWVLLGLAVACLGGVAVLAVTLSVGAVGAPPALHVPSVPAVPNAVDAIIAAAPVRLAADAETRRVEQLTFRLRNISCAAGSSGSGFAADAHTLITNRHVIAGAGVLQADTWDGIEMSLDVAHARTGKLVDIGVISVAQTLPVVAAPGPVPVTGAAVTAVGYPLGRQLTVTHGHLLRYVDGRTLPDVGFPGQVMEVSAPVKPGNSGGPLLDARGRLVGVVFAGLFPSGENAASSMAFALPLSAVASLTELGGEAPVRPCGL